jgi:Big-like domain-containing protein
MTELSTGAPHVAYGFALLCLQARNILTHFKIFLLFLYSFAVMSTVAPGHVNAASFQLTWVDNSQNEDGFNIERKLNTTGTFSLIATVGPDVTSYVDDNLANTTTYCYRVNAFNDAGNSAYTNEACGTTPATSPLPSGNGVSTNIANGAILSGSSVVWTATPSGSPVRVEFFIDGALLSTEYVSPYQFNGDPSGTLNTNTLSNGSHQLKVRAIYSDNSTAEQTITVTVSNGTTPTPPPLSSSTVTATLLGQTGEDIVGTTSQTPDGIQDVHIGLSGVQGTITGVTITGGDLGGRWETPFNGANWVVAIRPQTNPSLVDLYFDFFRPNSFYTLDVTFADGSIQTIQSSTSLSDASLRSDTVVTLTATPAAGSTFASGNSAVCTNSAATIDASKSCAATSQTAANQLITKIGVFRPDTGEWFLDRSGNGQWDGCSVDTCITSFGQPGDLPAIGSWSGAGTISIGTFNPTAGMWQLDRNGNGRWDGCAVDTCITSFGQPGDLPATRGITGFTEIIIGTFQPQQGLWKFDLNRNNTFDNCSIDE